MIEIYRDINNKVYAFSKKYNFDGRGYIVELRYNPINVSWYMTLKDINNNVIISSIRLVSKIYILRNKRAVAGLPDGDFKLIQVTENNGGGKILDFDSLGAEYKLYYVPVAEL